MALVEPAELDLINALADFPRVVAGAAESLEPHRVATYLLETARATHLWYAKHHVLGEPEPVLHARLVLARAAQIVIRTANDRTTGGSRPALVLTDPSVEAATFVIRD